MLATRATQFLLGCLCSASPLTAGTLHLIQLDTSLAASGTKIDFDAPTGVTDTGYLVDLTTGRIDIYDHATNSVTGQPFLDGITSSGGALTVFGMAFDPDYANNGRVFISYAENEGRRRNGRNFVVEYQRDPTDPSRLLPDPVQVILRIDEGPADDAAAGRHQGSDIGFGPDGYLYVTTGDAGGTPTGLNPAQDLTSPLGSVLRIDVSGGDDYPGDDTRNFAIPADNPDLGPGTDKAIWLSGLRNPFRANFDPVTGLYYIGDVGQDAFDEINVGVSGANYGWSAREGFGPGPGLGTGPFEDPIYALAVGSGPFEGRSVVGGVVYRGVLDDLYGEYLFGDFGAFSGVGAGDQIWSFDVDSILGPLATRKEWALDAGGGSFDQLVSFSTDQLGNVYLLDFDGDVFQISGVSATVPLPASVLLLGSALIGCGAAGRRIRRRPS